MKVAWLRPALTGEERDFLQELLASGITVEFPGSLPGSPDARIPTADSLPVTEAVLATVRDADVLVGSRFREEIVSAAARATVVIIPFAGPEASELALLKRFPQLTVCNSHYNAPFVAEHAMALLLAVAKQLLPYDRALRAGLWRAEEYSHAQERSRPARKALPSMALAGKTITVLGYGAIGSRVVEHARGFKMKVMVVRKNVDSGPTDVDFLGTPDDLKQILPQTDALVVCVPLTNETRHMLGAEHWRLMKPDAVVVNVSRGDVLEERAFYEVLETGEIAGAGIDAWYQYPAGVGQVQFPSKLPFHMLDNVVLSPHRAGDTDERSKAQIADVAQQLNQLCAGKGPSNILWRAAGDEQ